MRPELLALRVCCGLAFLLGATAAPADEKLEARTMKLDKLKLVAPEGWEKKEPRFANITLYEFHAPPAEGDDVGGRLTVSVSGGTVEANIQRWIDQFTQPDGSKTKDKAKIEQLTRAGHTVHVVDLSGTYKDQRGPAAPAVERAKYRMLGAIIETKTGNYYVKFYGPQKTMAEQEKAFRKMVDDLE